MPFIPCNTQKLVPNIHHSQRFRIQEGVLQTHSLSLFLSLSIFSCWTKYETFKTVIVYKLTHEIVYLRAFSYHLSHVFVVFTVMLDNILKEFYIHCFHCVYEFVFRIFEVTSKRWVISWVQICHLFSCTCCNGSMIIHRWIEPTSISPWLVIAQSERAEREIQCKRKRESKFSLWSFVITYDMLKWEREREACESFTWSK